MRKPKWMTLKGEWTNERIARAAFYVIIGVAALVFLLFYFIGFSKPYSYDPNFKDPIFTPLVMGFVVLIVVSALAVAILAGSSETINANGKPFTNALMLKGADMFVISSGVMLILTTAAAFYGMWHSRRVDE